MEKQNPISGQTLVRHHSISLVINTINRQEPLTKREIVKFTGLSFAKINSIIVFLQKCGIVSEKGKQRSNGGRPSILYQINADYRYIVGCELSHTRVRAVISNLKGNILASHAALYEQSSSPQIVTQKLLNCIQQSLNATNAPFSQILGIGVAIAGLVNPLKGSTRPFPHLVDWGEIPLKEIITKKFKLPTFVENVANAAALAEFHFGKGKGQPNQLYLNVGSGLGMGIIINGQIYEGTTGSAGEFGHITVNKTGPLCKCGNVGCLEAMASTRAVVNRAQELLQKGVISKLNKLTGGDSKKLKFQMICEAASTGDKIAFSMIDEMGRNLGEGIVTLINLFNPQIIIIGGKVYQCREILLNSITNVVLKRALEIPRKSTEIVFSRMNENASVIGSTIPLIEKFFNEAFFEEH